MIPPVPQAIHRKVFHREDKRAALSDSFQPLLRQLMTGQIRVDRLDIDASGIETT